MLALGPVQGFIAAARRTRDLWYGSQLLSGLTEAGAAALAKEGGVDIIFPSAPTPAAGAQGATPAPRPAFSNKIVCTAHTDDPRGLAGAVRTAVGIELEVRRDACLDVIRSHGLLRAVDVARFELQLTDAIECSAAWVAWPAGDDDDHTYLARYLRVLALLDARKRLRNFAPNPAAAVGARLSSLGADRETVLCPPNGRNARLLARARLTLGIDQTEELDALGLMKRVLGRQQPFPAVVRVALQPWITAWPQPAVQAVEQLLQPLEASGLASRSTLPANHPMAVLPYDGEMLMASRRAAWLRSAGAQFGPAVASGPPADADDEAARKTMADLHAAVNKLDADQGVGGAARLAGARLPDDDSLYVAMLVADGDRMGVRLAHPRTTTSRHRTLSGCLSLFAAQADAQVQTHHGVCIYAGGDDVMALLPVPHALACAEALARDFQATVRLDDEVLAPDDLRLSVGVVFAHVLTPFAELRQLALRACRLAKDGPDGQGLRNALAVVVQPRHGAAVTAVGSWDEPNPLPMPPGLAPRLHHWTSRFAAASQPLSHGVPYDLRRLARSVPAEALAAELQRLLRRRNASAEDQRLCGHQVLQGGRSGDAPDYQRLADEWYVARWLAARAMSDPAVNAGAPASPTALTEQEPQ